MIVYVSLAGSGTSDTLELALIAAAEAETELRCLAVIEDDQFGDVDTATMAMVAQELEFLLRAQLVAVRRRVTDAPAGHVEIHPGALADALGLPDSTIDEVLIGGPLPLDPEVVNALVHQLTQHGGVAVKILTS